MTIKRKINKKKTTIVQFKFKEKLHFKIIKYLMFFLCSIFSLCVKVVKNNPGQTLEEKRDLSFSPKWKKQF